MVRLDRIVTRAGDSGSTSLGGGVRLRKDHPRIEAMGAVDELSCAIGIAGTLCGRRDRAVLESVQRDLFVVGADLASPSGNAGKRPSLRVTGEMVDRIDAGAVRRAAALRPLRGFVLPGGSPPEAWLHLARAVCRRAERRAVAAKAGPGVVRYLNRLSDLLFVMARGCGGRPRVWEAPSRPRRSRRNGRSGRNGR